MTTYVVKQLAKEIRQGRCLRVERRHLLYSHSHDQFALAKLVEDSFHIFGSSREKLNFIGLIVKNSFVKQFLVVYWFFMITKGTLTGDLAPSFIFQCIKHVLALA